MVIYEVLPSVLYSHNWISYNGYSSAPSVYYGNDDDNSRRTAGPSPRILTGTWRYDDVAVVEVGVYAEPQSDFCGGFTVNSPRVWVTRKRRNAASWDSMGVDPSAIASSTDRCNSSEARPRLINPNHISDGRRHEHALGNLRDFVDLGDDPSDSRLTYVGGHILAHAVLLYSAQERQNGIVMTGVTLHEDDLNLCHVSKSARSMSTALLADIIWKYSSQEIRAKMCKVSFANGEPFTYVAQYEAILAVPVVEKHGLSFVNRRSGSRVQWITMALPWGSEGIREQGLGTGQRLPARAMEEPESSRIAHMRRNLWRNG